MARLRSVALAVAPRAPARAHSRSRASLPRRWRLVVMRRLVVTGLAAALTGAIAAPATATHRIDGRKWERQVAGIYEYAPRYFFRDEVPSDCRDRFREAAAAWNARNRELRYLEGSGRNVYIDVKYESIGWPYARDLGTSLLDPFTEITWQEIKFNTDADREGQDPLLPYCGTDTPATNQYDLMGVAMHELGHNQIQNHTDDAADIMSTFLPGAQKRTLSTHDIESFEALYPYVGRDYTSLASGGFLGVNESLDSPNRRVRLVMQEDGNLVLYEVMTGGSLRAMWWSNTFAAGSTAMMQTDGNLVVYTPSGQPAWHSRTFDNTGAFLAVQDDGNLVIYNRDGTSYLWNTGTFI